MTTKLRQLWRSGTQRWRRLIDPSPNHHPSIKNQGTDSRSATRLTGDQLYRALFQQSASGVYQLTGDGQIVEINPGLAMLLGYESPEDAQKQIGQFDRVYVDSAQRDLVRHQLETEGSVPGIECEWQRKDGSTIWVSQGVVLLRDGEGQAVACVGLVRDITEHKQVEDGLRYEKSLMDSLMDSVTDSIYFKDRDCRLIRISRNMEKTLAEEGILEYLGKTDTELFGELFSDHTLTDDRHVMATGETIVGLVEFRERANHTVVWTSTTKAPLRDANGEIVGVVGITREINEIMEARDALLESEENARAFQEQLKILHEVGMELSKADTFDELSRGIVELGRSRLGFDRLGLWFVDKNDPEYLVGGFGISEVGEISDNRTIKFQIDPQSGVGQTLREKMPIAFWADKPLYGRPGKVVGRGSHAVAILWDGDKGIGILAADNLLTHRPMTQNQLELLRLYSVTAGHLCVRQQAEEALRSSKESAVAFQEQLKVLHEVSLELSKSPTFDDLCRNAIALGLERLHFDRLGLWFCDENDPNYIVGSFGTDEQGRVRDERHHRRLPGRPMILHGLTNQHVVVFSENAELHNDRQEVVGRGDNALVFLWDGDRTIGWLAADNLFSHRPIDSQQLEILRLYTLSLAQLCTRKRAEDARREKEELLRRVIDANPNNIYVQDSEGRYILVNQRVTENYRLPQDAILGKTDRDLGVMSTADIELLQTRGREVIEKKQPGPVTEIAYPAAGGERRWFLISQNPLSLEGNPDCLLGVAVDITEQKRAEAQRLELARERERVQVLQRFMSGAAHDLITPLTTMKTSLYLMQRTVHDEQVLRRVDILENLTAHIEDAINNLLKFARLDRTAFRFLPTDLDRLVHDIAIEQRQLVADTDLQIVQEMLGGEKQVLVDHDEFRYVIRQLLANAIAYSPPGKSVVIKTDRVNDQAILSVIDEGEGVAPGDLEHIFEPFYRAEPREIAKGGFGLGLTIVKWIVEAHGGEIAVESAPGRGSTFRVSVPLIDSHDTGSGRQSE